MVGFNKSCNIFIIFIERRKLAHCWDSVVGFYGHIIKAFCSCFVVFDLIAIFVCLVPLVFLCFCFSRLYFYWTVAFIGFHAMANDQNIYEHRRRLGWPANQKRKKLIRRLGIDFERLDGSCYTLLGVF